MGGSVPHYRRGRGRLSSDFCIYFAPNSCVYVYCRTGAKPIFSKKSLKQGVRSRFLRENRLNTLCERDFDEKIA